jgi:hypothetical protein
MSTPIKKLVKVIEAKYVEDADSILIVGECEDGKFNNQINSSCFTFGNKDRVVEMKKTAALMVGKSIYMVFDTELDQKIKSHSPINY